MIQFELNKPLNIFFNQMLAYMDQTFVPCSKYILEDDRITALGETHSITLSFADGTYETTESMSAMHLEEQWSFVEENSVESELIKYAYTVFRMWKQIPPYASEHMKTVLLSKLNHDTVYYDILVADEATKLVIQYSGDAVTLEEAIHAVVLRNAGQNVKMKIRSDFEEAERLRGLGHHEEALPFYKLALEKEDKASNIYSLASFGIGEVYYFMNDMEKTVKSYLRCNVKLLADETELYKRLGHAFLDDRMKSHTDYIKEYFKGRQNVPYAKQHKDETEEAYQKIGEMFDEYEATCIEIGKKQYQTFAKKLKP